MIYIVSGVMRSLTSGMMKALQAGGMTAVYSTERDARLQEWYGDEHYQPNPEFMEMDLSELKAALLAPEQMDGKLIKLLYEGLQHLPPYEYRILFMKRDPEEIRMSCFKFFNGRIPQGKMRQVLGDYENITNEIIASMRLRADVRSVTVLHHANVIRNPLSAFALLTTDGWPVDICKAAAVIDGRKHRTKAEAIYA